MLTALMPVKSYHPPYLRAAVASVVAQTSPDWRLLVIDEGSGRAELERLLPDDRRIELVARETPTLAGALNTGMRRAETVFVAILLADDLWSPRAVEVVVRGIAASPETDFFHSSRRFVDDDGRPISSVYRSRERVSAEDYRRGETPVKHLLCWRRTLGLEVGGMDESLGSVGVDDYDFPWTMTERGATFTAIPDCLYIARDHRSSFRLTTDLPLSHHKRELARIMRKHGVDRATIRARIARAEQGYLRQCLYRNRLDRALSRRDPGGGWREPYT